MRTQYWASIGANTLSRRRLLKGSAIAGVGVAGLGLVGCGDDDDDEPDATATSGTGQTPGASPTTAVAQPVKGGTLRVAQTSAPATWDAYVNAAGPGQAHWGAMTNRILRLNTDEKDSFTLQGDVASEVPQQPDLQTIVIKVRDNVTYQNIAPVNGRKLTAKDVAFSIQRYKDIGQQKTQMAAIETIDVPDDTTVILKLNKPTVSLIAVFGDPKAVWIMAEEVHATEVGPTGPFIGTGPFMFEKYDTDVQISYVKNPDYWETGLPHVDRFHAPIIEQRVTQEANFRTGQLHYFESTSKLQYDELRKINGVQEENLDGSSMQRQEFALHVPPFDNVLVRQAMAMATNRDEMAAANDYIDYRWHTHAFPAKWDAHVLDPQNATEFGENAKYFQYDPTEAKAMLSAAGYADGFETVLHFTPYYVGAQVNGELMVDQWAKVGVKLTLDAAPYTEYQETYKNSKPVTERLWTGLVAQNPASYSDPSLHFTTYWLPSSGRNMQLYEDDWLVEQFNKQDQELDREARHEILREMQRHMAFQMNGITLNTPSNAQLFHRELRNVNLHKNSAGGRAVDTWARVWIDENA